MKPSLLAVDLSNQVYRAIYAHPTLSSGGIYTGGVYGLLVQMSTALTITQCSRVIFLTDRKPYVRQRDCSTYKAGRTADEAVVEARQESMRLATELAEACGIPVWGIPGYEADDLAGLLCVRHRHRYDTIWSMSNDTDLHQLMWCQNFRTLAQPPQQKKGGERKPPLITSPELLQKRLGISAEQLVLMLALSGTHNAVRGIPGIGEKRSLEAVRDQPEKLRVLQDKHAELIARNIGLIRLPHPSIPLHSPIPAWRGFNLRALYIFCERHDIHVTPAMVSAFGNLHTT